MRAQKPEPAPPETPPSVESEADTEGPETRATPPEAEGDPAVINEDDVGTITVSEDGDCDLDCVESQLTEAKREDDQKKGLIKVVKESEPTVTDPTDNAGDALASEPSTTSLDKESVPESKKGRLPSRLGPLRITVDKRGDWVGIGFATQLEFDYDQQFAGGGISKASDQTLQFRRLRLSLSSSFVDGKIRSGFQINLTPSALELLDMWLAFTRFKFATLRMGQFKIPFDRYRAQSYAVLSFVDWSPTTTIFGSERQMGLEAFARGGFLNLEYAFGIFTGTNARASHGIGAIEFYGETPTNPSELGDGEIFTDFHPELVGRVAKNIGDINTDTNSDVLGSADLRQSIGFGFAYDARADPIVDLTLRLSFEWLAKIRGFDFNVISYLAWFPPWEGGPIEFGPVGFMGEVGYRFNALWELATRYSITYLPSALRQDTRSYGQFQIATADDAAAAEAQYGLNGDQITEAELALAGAAHIIGNSLKTTLQTSWVNERWVQGARNGLRVELQVQFLF
ncbi:MAG: porin [Polyangiales bacterium]